MKNVRIGIFETNSSSTHSLTIVPKEEYDEFKSGIRFYDRWNDALVTKEEYEKLIEKFKDKNPDMDEDELAEYLDDEGVMNYDKYQYMDYETFSKSYKTKNGDEVVAFGYYGTDY
jgi:hypothetical protein